MKSKKKRKSKKGDKIKSRMMRIRQEHKDSFASDYHSNENTPIDDPLSMLPKKVIGPPPKHPGFVKFFSEVMKSSKKNN